MFARSLAAIAVLACACSCASSQNTSSQTGSPPTTPSQTTPAPTTFPDHCPDGRPFPFGPIQARHPIDGVCGLQGKEASSDETRLQNTVKNNLCGVPQSGKPETFTPQDLIDLQKKTDLPMGSGKEPADRGVVQKLGEGKIVRMKASLIEAHYADVGDGESVNCNQPKEEDNDIHIAFGVRPDSPECESVTGEISPHFRPETWGQIGNFEKFDEKADKSEVNRELAARLQGQPYRVTGQLFFDSSHAVCPCGTKCKPSRSSGWEIHPIYNVEICKPGSACNVDSDSDWLPFDVWWKSLPVPRKASPPPRRSLPEKKKAARGSISALSGR